MALVQFRLNAQQSVQCELPDELTGAFDALIAKFKDDIFNDLYPRIQDMKKDIPDVQAAAITYAEAVKELLAGSPVKELASFDAAEQSLKLDNMLKIANSGLEKLDPSVVRLNERKLGAANVLCINGRIFKMTTGIDLASETPTATGTVESGPATGKNRVEILRYLWETAGGIYNNFVALGNAIGAYNDGTFVFYEYRAPSEEDKENGIPYKFPYVNKSFSSVASLSGYGSSLFKHRIFWKNTVSASNTCYNKLKLCGFTDDQIVQISTGNAPNQNYNFSANLTIIKNKLQNLGYLLLLNDSSPLKQPLGFKEYTLFKDTLTSFLDWRLKFNTSSSVFDVNYWKIFRSTFSAEECKELFEERPEVKDIVLPVNWASTVDIIQKAVAIKPSGTTMINSYLTKASDEIASKIIEFTTTLYDFGIEFLNCYSTLLTTSNIKILENLLKELKGSTSLPAKPENPVPTLTVPEFNQIFSTFPSNSFTASSIQLTTKVSKCPDLLNYYYNSLLKFTTLTITKTVTTTTTTTITGLSTCDSFASLLMQVFNFLSPVECSLDFQDSGQTGFSQMPSTYEDFAKTSPGDPNAPSAKERTLVENNQGGGNSANVDFQLDCVPVMDFIFLQQMSKIWDDISDFLKALCVLLKEKLFELQKIVDDIIIEIQRAINFIIAFLSSLLTWNFNLTGGLGFENSILKCSWNFDLGLKIDLLGLLLYLLGPLIGKLGAVIDKAIGILKDLITKYICIPVRMLEAMLGAVNALLGLIGCSLKDINIPDEILDFLNALLGTFDLRTLVIGEGNADWLDARLNLEKGGEQFAGLAQFAGLCQNDYASNALDLVESTAAKLQADLPFQQNDLTYGVVAKGLAAPTAI